MRRKVRIPFITAVFAFLLATLGLTVTGVNAAELSPYEPVESFSLAVQYNDTADSLVLETTGAAVSGDYGYQYWIKERIQTESAADPVNLASQQYLWQPVEGGAFGAAEVTIADISAKDYYKDEAGNYNVLVRIKEISSGKIVESINRTLTAEDISYPVISEVAIDGRAILDGYTVISDEAFTLTVKTNLPGLNISVSGAGIDESNTKGTFAIDGLKQGLNVLTLKAGAAEKKIKLNVYSAFKANERPSIVGLSTSQDGSTATFTIRARYADGSAISDIDLSKINFSVISGGINGTSAAEPYIDVNGDAVAAFTVGYGGADFGIYYTEANVSRKEINGYDDLIIRYYTGYNTRVSSLNVTATVSEAESYTAALGNAFEITADGTIADVAESDTTYAFYREDASGWVLIKNYSTDGVLNWQPTKAGTYNIQTRIKDANSCTYENVKSQTYTVTGGVLSGTLDIAVTDYNSQAEITDGRLKAGTPYIFQADRTGGEGENALYMFTVYSSKLGEVYLNKYQPDNKLVYIPMQSEDITVTARAINANNFGYKDITATITLDVYIASEQFISASDFAAANLEFKRAGAGLAVDFSEYLAGKTDEKLTSALSGNLLSVAVKGSPKINTLATLSGNVLTFTTAQAQSLGMGAKTLVMTTEKEGTTYYLEFKANIADVVVMTKDDLDSLKTLLMVAEPMFAYWDGYVLLGADIEYNGVFEGVCNMGWGPTGGFVGSNVYADFEAYNLVRGFRGTFDGNGHYISGVEIPSDVPWQNNGDSLGYRSFFGSIAPEGVVKNVAFINSVVNSTYHGSFLASYNGGLIKDVFVSGEVIGTSSPLPNSLLVCQNWGVIENAITEVTNEPEAVLGMATPSGGSTVYRYVYTVKSPPYGFAVSDTANNFDTPALLKENVAVMEIIRDNFNSDIWDFDNYFMPIFKSTAQWASARA